MADTEFKTTFGLDDQITAPLNRIIKLFDSFNDNIESAEKNLNGLSDENFSNLNSGLDEVNKNLGKVSGGNFNSVSKDADRLKSSLNGVSSEADGVRGSLNRLDGTSFSGIKSEAGKVESSLGGIEGEAKKAKSKLDEIGQADVTPQGLDGLSDQLAGLTDAVNLNTFFDMSEAIQGAIEKMGELVSVSFDSAETMAQATNSIKIGLGATGEELSSLKGIAFDVFSQNYGESFQDVTDKLVYMKQVMGDLVSEGDLGPMLEQFITLEGSGMDFNETVRAAKQLMGTFGVSGSEAMDLLTAGMQGGLNYSQELSDNLAEYSARWKDSGVSASQYFSLLKAGVESGSYNLDKVGDFLNEFMTSLTDGRMEKAMGSFSQSTQDVFSAFKDQKATVKEVLDAVIGDMQNMTSETDRAALASTLWSSLGEDNCMDMILALGNVQDQFTNISGAAAQAAADNSTAVGQLRRYWEAFQLSLAPIGEGIAQLILAPINAIKTIGSTIGQLITGELTFPDLTDQGVELIDSFVSGVTTGLPKLVQQGWQAVMDFVSGMKQKVPELVLGAVDMITTLVSNIGQNLPALVQGAGQTITAFTQGLRNNLPQIVASAIEIVKNIVSGFWQRLPDIIEAGMNLIIGLGQGIISALPYILQSAVDIGMALLNTLWQNIPNILTYGLELVKAMIIGIGQGAAMLVVKGFELIVKLCQAIANAVPQLVSTAYNLAVDFLTGFQQGLAGIWTSVTSWFQENFGWILDWVKSLFGIASPSTVFAEIGDNLIAGFLGGLKNAWTSVTSWFSSAWEGLKNTVSNWWNNLWGGGEDEQSAPTVDYTATIEATKAQIQELQNVVASGFNAILSQINVIMSGITASMVAQFSVISGTVLAQVSALVAQTGAGLAGIMPYIQGIYNAFLAATVVVLNALKAQTLVQTQDMINQMSASVGGLNSVFVAAFNMISFQTLNILNQLNISSIAVLTSLSVSAAAIMEQTRANMVNTVNAMVSAIITAYNLIASRSIAIISSMATALIASYSVLVTSLIKLMNSLASSVLDIVSRLVKSIQSTIGILPAYFYSIGQSMMVSLRAGIEASRSGVISTTSSLVQQLKNTFESGLGIHSPSDYMIWIGQMLLAGLIQGMSGSQVQKFIENMISNMQTSFENGKFNANELVNFLSDPATLALIGKVTGIDTKGMSAQQIAYPLMGTLGTITSWFGNRPASDTNGVGSTDHGGIDIAAPQGTPIAAALAGNVTVADWYGGYGQAVVIDSGNGIDITYGHMSAIGTTRGATVQKGQQIGLVGSTGWSTGPHLHFEMHQNGQRVDPYPYLQGAGIIAGNTLAGAIQTAYNSKHGIVSVSSGNVSYDVGAGASQWTNVVLQALAMLGQPASLLQGVLYAIENESGGNPNARNDWDSNAAIGQNSAGLLQTIPDTFNAYRNPSLSNNIYDPLANVYAALNYMIQRYGSVDAVVTPRLGGWYGYEVGTRYVPSDMLAMIHEGEAIIPAGQNPYSQSGGDYLSDIASRFVDTNTIPSPTVADTGAVSFSVGDIHTTVNVTGSNANPQEIAQAVSQQVMNDMRSAMERKAGVPRGY